VNLEGLEKNPAKITLMRLQERLRPVLEDFVVFAKRVDRRFLSFIEKEDLYRGIREAKELEREVRGPLKRVYVKWVRKSFEFLRDRDVELELKGVFEENPWYDVLHYLGIQRIYVSPEKLELGKLYGHVDESLGDFIDEYVSKGYFWRLALNIRALFSRVLSEKLTQAIQEGYPEKHVRVIQTAIAVIKNDPESLPKGEPKSFVEKWLRGELEDFMEV